MKLPPSLQALYSTDFKLSAFTLQALARVEDHISANRMVFFPEYTDHGTAHVELTLQTAFDLATNAARDLLTPIDATVLTVAVSLHDLGMHITKDGFESLISKGSRWKGVDFFDKRDWNSLWSDFYAEATRFDGRKLRELFGDQYRPVRPIPSNGSPWEDFDYLLVGEFIRRHHPRLAHDIAVFGLPGKDGNAIEICQSSSEEQRFIADISGLIARSHGMDLRSCLEYVEQKYKNRIDPRRAHPAFLATLLRIADYFQIQAARAPTARTDVATFQSVLSEREWTVHQSVTDIHNTSSDPEAIVVIAEPRDVETFLRIRNWIGGLQKELDQSWAILGEVYGLQSHNNLNLLGLKIRRIKSNLDNVAAFAKTVDYIPERIAFEAANADLLKLLVAPLYGNNPAVGFRELIQNGIDAVRELEDSLARHSREVSSIDRREQEADVVIEIKLDDEQRPSEIIVTDRGIGMTAETVRDYFLKAGASFRRSQSWREEHEDDTGHSRVLRTGRFGVGALAAFLLGDQIEVITRHAFSNASDGIRFIARLDDNAISISRTSCQVGTKIRVVVSERDRNRIQLTLPQKHENNIRYNSGVGHYFLKSPSLHRIIGKHPQLKVEGWLPSPTDDISLEWRWFKTDDFEKIFWTYSREYPTLSSNGIVITRMDYSYSRSPHPMLSMPNLSVFDKDGLLPVNLQRSGLQSELPFREELLRSITTDLAAYALVEAPETPNHNWIYGGGYEGFAERSPYHYREWSRWCFGNRGFFPNLKNLVIEARPNIAIAVIGGGLSKLPLLENLRNLLPAGALAFVYAPRELAEVNVKLKGPFLSAVSGNLRPETCSTGSYTVYIPETLVNNIRRLDPGKAVRRGLDRLSKETSDSGWKAFPSDGLDEGAILREITTLPIDDDNPMIICAYEVAADSSAKKEDPVATRWMELVEGSILPFSNAERHGLLESFDKDHYLLREIRQTLRTNRERKARVGSDELKA